MAESLYRAHFVQYLTWVHEHTIPLLVNSPVGNEIAAVDVEALTDLADAIAHCMARTGRASHIVPFLDRIEQAVPLEGFRRRATLLRATWLHVGVDDQAGARREISKLGDVLSTGRRDALELYLDLFGSDLPARQKIVITEAILEMAGTDANVKLQYTAVKSVALLELGEKELAASELRKVVDSVPIPSQIETSADVTTAWHLAKAWALCGNLTDDQSAFRHAEDLLVRIPEDHLTSLGRARMLLDLGWVLRDQERFQEAAREFKRSFDTNPSEVANIHLAHAQVLAGDAHSARKTLDELEQQPLDDDLRIEFLAAKGALAISAGDTALAAQTVAHLRNCRVEQPFWAAQRDQIVIQLLDFVGRPESAPSAERQGRILRLLLSINRALELKPNICGVGLNLNAVFETIIERLQR